MMLPPADFESAASTISPLRRKMIYRWDTIKVSEVRQLALARTENLF